VLGGARLVQELRGTLLWLHGSAEGWTVTAFTSAAQQMPAAPQSCWMGRLVDMGHCHPSVSLFVCAAFLYNIALYIVACDLSAKRDGSSTIRHC
jgi:hypothetical protein